METTQPIKSRSSNLNEVEPTIFNNLSYAKIIRVPADQPTIQAAINAAIQRTSITPSSTAASQQTRIAARGILIKIHSWLPTDCRMAARALALAPIFTIGVYVYQISANALWSGNGRPMARGSCTWIFGLVVCRCRDSNHADFVPMIQLEIGQKNSERVLKFLWQNNLMAKRFQIVLPLNYLTVVTVTGQLSGFDVCFAANQLQRDFRLLILAWLILPLGASDSSLQLR